MTAASGALDRFHLMAAKKLKDGVPFTGIETVIRRVDAMMLHDEAAAAALEWEQAQAISESRRVTLLEKADELRREWIRAEKAESAAAKAALELERKEVAIEAVAPFLTNHKRGCLANKGSSCSCGLQLARHKFIDATGGKHWFEVAEDAALARERRA